MFDFEKCINRLIALRKAKGYSQESVGILINLSKQAVNNIEKGRMKLTLDKACTLAEFYGVSLDSLVGISELPSEVGLTEDEKIILNNYRSLDDKLKGRLIERSEILKEQM